MNTCEFQEMQASALLDGELGYHEQILLVDHLLACPACRAFYGRARELQDFVDELPEDTGFAGEPVPHEGPALAPPSADVANPVRAAQRAPRWIWAAAASIIFLIFVFSGGGLLDSEDAGEGAPLARALPAAGNIDVRLASDNGQLDDERFVALTLELLRGDARYHRKMYDLLGELRAGEVPVEGEAMTALYRDEGGFSPTGEQEHRRREDANGEAALTATF